MKKYALGFIALLVIALLTPGLGQAATYGTSLWTDLKSYNFSTQSTWDSNSRLKPIESFSDGESAYAHYLIGPASSTSVINTAPFNVAGYKTLAITQFTSTIGIGETTPTVTINGASEFLVDVWGRPGKDDVWGSTTSNIYDGNLSGTTAQGSPAMGLIVDSSGTIAYSQKAMTCATTLGGTAGVNGTYVWNLGGAYGGIILSASAGVTSSGTTHIMIRVSK